jgi:hypothetical protein
VRSFALLRITIFFIGVRHERRKRGLVRSSGWKNRKIGAAGAGSFGGFYFFEKADAAEAAGGI